MTGTDVEKAATHEAVVDSSPANGMGTTTTPKTWLQRLEYKAGLEARGIQRVGSHERQKPSKRSIIQIAVLWISINLCANNVALGLLGPSIFGLSFKDSALCAVFGAIVGSIPTAYIATWGPISGNRSLVSFRGLDGVGSTVADADILLRSSPATRWVGGRVRSACCSTW